MDEASHMALPELSWMEKCYPKHMPRTGKPNICEFLMPTLLLEVGITDVFLYVPLSIGKTHQATHFSC